MSGMASLTRAQAAASLCARCSIARSYSTSPSTVHLPRHSAWLIRTQQLCRKARWASRSTFAARLQTAGLATSAQRLDARTPDPGGKPVGANDRTVYDDFVNIIDPNNSSSTSGPVSITSMSPTSFTLSDGLVVSQPLVFLNGEVFLWNAPTLDRTRAAPNGQGWEEWLAQEGGRDEIWKLFEVVAPKPEILLFGTGATVIPPPPQIRAYLGGLGIQIEVQDSRNAGSTYNMLLEEGRRVAAALLPNERS